MKCLLTQAKQPILCYSLGRNYYYFLILQRRILRHREVQWHAQFHLDIKESFGSKSIPLARDASWALAIPTVYQVSQILILSSAIYYSSGKRKPGLAQIIKMHLTPEASLKQITSASSILGRLREHKNWVKWLVFPPPPLTTTPSPQKEA